MFIPTQFEGLWVIEPKVFGDSRGYFFESFNQRAFKNATGMEINFVQDNQSKSSYGVLRGLHLQLGEYAQAKLVRMLSGEVLDLVVDVRKKSPTFGQSYSILLSAENKKQLFVPRGFAHGFVVLSETAEFFYKCDNYYTPQFESGIAYNDPDLSLDWRIDLTQVLVSERDKKLPLFKDFVKNMD
jgi:dTDP-4-dehydrorhamnose 3,5-epimerase